MFQAQTLLSFKLSFFAISFTAVFLQMRFPVLSSISQWLDTDSEQMEAETLHSFWGAIIAFYFNV